MLSVREYERSQSYATSVMVKYKTSKVRGRWFKLYLFSSSLSEISLPSLCGVMNYIQVECNHSCGFEGD